MNHFLKNWSPWTFVKEYEKNEKGEDRLVGTKAVFHKSFHRWKNRVYDVKGNKWIALQPTV